LCRPVSQIFQFFLFALLTVLPWGRAFADPATADQAKRTVQGWLRAEKTPLQAKLGSTIKGVDTYNDAKGSALYHVVRLEPNGFVIVAADDYVEPIIAFSSSGTFDPSTKTPIGALIARDLPNRMANVKGLQRAKAKSFHLSARNKWDQMSASAASPTSGGVKPMVSGSPTTSVSDLRVAPLVQTTWDQSLSTNEWTGPACYNYYTPPYAAGNVNNDVCGCVATAMAQLMRYWQYPVNGVGTTSFPILVDGNLTTRSLLGGDGNGGPYAWSSMPTNPAGGTTLTQRQAIGALCADAGVAVDMSYTAGNSGAYLWNTIAPLKSTFRYGNANNIVFNGSIVFAAINPNLDAGCPVLLAISGDGGHAIVCDGYGYNSSTPYHHLNLGWSGQATAWYNLPNIDTTQEGGGDTFTSVDQCEYNVFTNGTGEIISGRVTDSTGANPIPGATVTAKLVGGGTYTTTTDAHGIYAFARIPSSAQYFLAASSPGYTFTSLLFTNTGFSADGYCYWSNPSQRPSSSFTLAGNGTCGNQWGVNFSAGDSSAPGNLAAVSGGTNQINLSWTRNGANANVLVAWNISNTFGTPTGSYSAGDTISGGGTVLYNGSGTSAPHTVLPAGTRYYYKAWSVSAGPSYSSGATCAGNTDFGIPYTESLEGATLPAGWSQERDADTMGLSWSFQAGDGTYLCPASNSDGGAGGSKNACFINKTDPANTLKGKLVMPMLNFGSMTQSPQLSFYLCMSSYYGSHDSLNVYYKTSATGAWTLLQAYNAGVETWTKETISLPNINGTYYLAFDAAGAGNNNGICIDDVQVTASPAGNLSSQTIVFSTPSPQVTTNTVTLSATASSGLTPVTFSILSGPGVASGANGSTLTFTGVGTVVVVASQAGNASWSAATATNTITVNYALATITLTPSTLTQTYSGSPCVVTATTVPAGLATNITYNGGGTAPTSAGSYVVTGTVVSALYQGSTSGTLVVNKASQTITGFSTPSPQITTNVVTLSATASSGLSVTYTNISGPGSISGNTLTFTGAGTVVVVAYQGGNANYYAATPVTNTITVNYATAIVTLTPSTLSQTYSGAPCVVTATTVPSGLTTNITYNGSGTAPTAAGSYAVTGTVVSSSMYQGSVNGTLVVNKASQTISFPTIPNQLTNTTYTFSPATVASGLTISYAVVAGGSIATLTSGTTLQFNSTTGSVSVAASQAGNGNWNAATSVTNSFLVTNSQVRLATTFYVATNGSDSANGLTWATAKQTIQSAVNLTQAGDSVLVSNGVYATGGQVTPGGSLLCRVVIPSGITVRSVNGAGVTTINGAVNSSTVTNGDGAVRCVCFGANAVLSGFTLTNGHTRGSSGDMYTEQRGGAVYCADTSCVVSNCILTGCSGNSWGGAAEGCTLINCLIAGNWAGSGGGGADSSTMINCTIAGNAGSTGSGTEGCTLENCIVYANTGGGLNFNSGSLNYCCTTPAPGSGVGNTASDPKFVNAAAGNFHLQATSPCKDAGNNAYVTSDMTTDLDGNPRTVNTTVDMGAYEYQSASTVLLTATAGANGTVTPASTNASIGSSPVFSIQASAYYRILSLTTNVTSVGAFNNNSTSTNFIWSNVQAAGTLNANFTDQVTPDPGHPTYTWLHAHGFATDTNCVNGSDSPTTHGLLVWQEFLAGTDPTNASSQFRISGITPVGGSNTVQWLSSAAVQAPYALLYCTNLANGVWTLYTNNIPATPPTNSLTLPKPGSSSSVFYRVTVTATN